MSYEACMMAAFCETLKLAEVSEDEALASAKILSEGKRSRLRRYVDSGTVGGVLTPAVDTVGNFVHAAANAKKSPLAAGVAGVKAMKRGDVARSVTKGILGGAAVRAGQEGMQLQRAKDTYNRFMRQEGA